MDEVSVKNLYPKLLKYEVCMNISNNTYKYIIL